jgi:Recombination endonuclease VII
MSKKKQWRIENPERWKEIQKKARAKWIKNHPEDHKRIYREAAWKNKGIVNFSYAQYLKLLKKQKEKCKICKLVMENPCVDHDHSTGIVRGILCWHCNIGLGHFDDPKLLKNALKYLQR